MYNNRVYVSIVQTHFRCLIRHYIITSLRLTLPIETYFNTSLLNAFFIPKQPEKYPYIHHCSDEYKGHNFWQLEMVLDLGVFQWMLKEPIKRLKSLLITPPICSQSVSADVNPTVLMRTQPDEVTPIRVYLTDKGDKKS